MLQHLRVPHSREDRRTTDASWKDLIRSTCLQSGACLSPTVRTVASDTKQEGVCRSRFSGGTDRIFVHRVLMLLICCGPAVPTQRRGQSKSSWFHNELPAAIRALIFLSILTYTPQRTPNRILQSENMKIVFFSSG